MKLISKENKFKLAICLFFSILGDVFIMQALLGMSNVMDMAVKLKTDGIVKEILLTTLYLVCQWGCSYMKMKFCQKFIYDTRDSILLSIIKSLFRLPLSKVKEKNSDYYMSLLNNDIEDFRTGYLWGVFGILSYSISVVVAAVTLLRVHYFMLIATVILTIIPILVSKMMTGKTISINKERTAANEAYLSRLQEMVKGLDVIKRSNNSKSYASVFEKANSRRSNSYKNYGVVTNMIWMTMYSLGSINQLLLIGICAFLITKNIIEPGLIVATTSGFAIFSDAFSNAIENGVEMKSAKVFLDKFRPYLGKNNEIADNESLDIRKSERDKASIDIENLSFAYDDKRIFNEFSLNIDSGEIVAITGESGSGKSTLINLLLKSFKGYSGKIKYDNEELRDIKEDELYSKVYLVPQDSFIFKSSLYDNVTMFNGNSEGDKERFRDIIEKVNLKKFMELHKDDELNPDEMSGGEKKRVSIARALFNNPEIIILDEPTSDLDPENKGIVNDIIFSLKDKTRLVVTHDWAEEYLKKFDKVVRL